MIMIIMIRFTVKITISIAIAIAITIVIVIVIVILVLIFDAFSPYRLDTKSDQRCSPPKVHPLQDSRASSLHLHGSRFFHCYSASIFDQLHLLPTQPLINPCLSALGCRQFEPMEEVIFLIR